MVNVVCVCVGGALSETNLKPTIKRTISQLAFGYHQLLEIQTTSRIKIRKDGLCSPASSTKVTLSPCQLQKFSLQVLFSNISYIKKRRVCLLTHPGVYEQPVRVQEAQLIIEMAP